MTFPRLRSRLSVLIALTAICGASSVLRAEQPPAMTPAPAESKAAPPPRARPQIIYRVPRTPSYAASLHSQAKTHPLPIDNSMPPSLQLSRAAANEAAAKAAQDQSVANNQSNNARNSRQQKVKRPKTQSNRPQIQSRGSFKARGPGKSRGKSGKR
jgi:hypothetical protein